MIDNVPPSLTITAPATDIVVSRGWRVTLGYTDDDPDDVATTRMFADADGDLSTTGDQYPLTDARPDQDGAPQEFVSELTGVPEGTYSVIGLIADARHAALQVVGPGKLIVSNVAWAKPAGSVAADVGVSLADGSSVGTGMFRASVTFGAGEPNQTTLVSSGGTDTFVARYAADGALAWAKRAGGDGNDWGTAIALLADGSSVVAGAFAGTATFGEGETRQATLVSAGSYDIFVARYAADGSLAWAKRAGGTQEDRALAIATQPDGSSVVMGEFVSPATFGSGEPNQTTLTSSLRSGTFLARYSAEGTLAWAKRAVEGGWSPRIAALADGSIVAIGTFFSTTTFGPEDPNRTTLLSAGAGDIFVARYGADGALAWAVRAGGSFDDTGTAITALPEGSSVVTGSFRGTVSFGDGSPTHTTLTSDGLDDIFVARYAADGSLVWAKRAGGPASTSSDNDQGRGIAALADGSTVVTGHFALGATFGAGESRQTTLYSEVPGGWPEAFVARYAPDRSLVWAKRVAGGGAGSAITALEDGSSIVTGSCGLTATFGPGESNETSIQTQGAFVARFNAGGGF